MLTDINSEDRLVQQTFADHLRDRLGWESVYAYNHETFGPGGTLGRASKREVVLTRDLRDAVNGALSRIDFRKLREEFAGKVKRKEAALQDIRALVERKLQQMLKHNPRLMDYYRRYQEILADYNREKDRATVEQTFAQLLDLAASLDAEERRTVQEGLNRDELALFDLLSKDNISKTEREKLKQASHGLLASLLELLRPMERWTEKETTQAEVRVFILDRLTEPLPNPPYTPDDRQRVAEEVYNVWQRSAGGYPLEPTAA